MAVNPMQLMKLRERFQIFQGQHPRMAPFLKDVGEHGFREGSVVEVKVTTPEGICGSPEMMSRQHRFCMA